MPIQDTRPDTRHAAGSAAAESTTADDAIERRYRFLEKIGEGGMGIVWRVERIRDGRLLALKRIKPRLSPEALARLLFDGSRSADDESKGAVPGDDAASLYNEYRHTGSLRHPNLVAIHDLETTAAGDCFLVMELLAGESLDRRFARADYSAAALANWLRQLLLGLSFLHGKGLVHRDLKPSNLFLCQDGCLKILDYGLLTERQEVAGPPAGTTDYFAPELKRGFPQTSASDLYAVGAILRLGLDQLRTSEPPAVALGLRQKLAQMSKRLLATQATRRWASAEDVLHFLAEVSQADDARGEGTQARSLVLGARLLGREREMHELDSALLEARQGRGQFLLISGESGIGKTRLTQEFAHRVKMQGGRILSAGYTEHEPDELAPLRELLRQMIPLSSAATLKAHRRTLQPLAPETFPLAPPTAGIQAIADPESVAIAVIAYWQALAEQLSSPLLVLVEDLHFAPALSYFKALARESAGTGLLLLATVRDDELRTPLPPHTNIILRPFPPEYFPRLIEQTFHQEAAGLAFVTELQSLTSGNPFLIEQLLLELADSGALRRKAAMWQAAPEAFHQLRMSRADEILQRRAQRLSKAERRLLCEVAAFRHDVSKALIARLCEDASHSDVLLGLCRRCLLVEQDGRVRTYHHRIKEHFYALVPDKVALHRRLAQLLEEFEADNVEELAHHYLQGKDKANALRNLTKAEHAAYAGNRIQRALGYNMLREELLLREGIEGQQLADHYIEKGNCLQLLNRWDEALRAFRKAWSLAHACGSELFQRMACDELGRLYRLRDDQRRARLWLLRGLKGVDRQTLAAPVSSLVSNLAVLSLQESRFDEARTMFEEQIRLADRLGDRLTCTVALGHLSRLEYEQGNFTAALRYARRHYRLYCELDIPIGILNACKRLALHYGTVNELAKAFDFLDRYRRLVEEQDDDFERTNALSISAAFYLTLGDTAAAEPLINEQRKLSLALNLSEGLCSSHLNQADWHRINGDYDLALQEYRRALDLARPSRRHYKIVRHLIGAIRTLHLQKDYRRAQEFTAECLASARATSNPVLLLQAELLTAKSHCFAERGPHGLPAAACKRYHQRLLKLGRQYKRKEAQAALQFEMWYLARASRRYQSEGRPAGARALLLFRYLFARMPHHSHSECIAALAEDFPTVDDALQIVAAAGTGESVNREPAFR